MNLQVLGASGPVPLTREYIRTGPAIARTLLTAVVWRPAVAPLAMAAGTGRAQRLREFDHLVLVFGLRRSVGLHARVANLLYEHRPGRVLRRNGRAVGAAPFWDRQQVGRLGERQRGVLDRHPTTKCARERVGGHPGVMAGDELHVSRIVGLRG